MELHLTKSNCDACTGSPSGSELFKIVGSLPPLFFVFEASNISLFFLESSTVKAETKLNMTTIPWLFQRFFAARCWGMRSISLEATRVCFLLFFRNNAQLQYVSSVPTWEPRSSKWSGAHFHCSKHQKWAPWPVLLFYERAAHG